MENPEKQEGFQPSVMYHYSEFYTCSLLTIKPLFHDAGSNRLQGS